MPRRGFARLDIEHGSAAHRLGPGILSEPTDCEDDGLVHALRFDVNTVPDPAHVPEADGACQTAISARILSDSLFVRSTAGRRHHAADRHSVAVSTCRL